MYNLKWALKVEKVAIKHKGKYYKLNKKLVVPYALACLPMLAIMEKLGNV